MKQISLQKVLKGKLKDSTNIHLLKAKCKICPLHIAGYQQVWPCQHRRKLFLSTTIHSILISTSNWTLKSILLLFLTRSHLCFFESVASLLGACKNAICSIILQLEMHWDLHHLQTRFCLVHFLEKWTCCN